MLSIAVNDSKQEQPVCKGLFFRVSISAYRSKNTINKKTTYRLLKKLSCTGCSQCGCLWDDLQDNGCLVIDAGEHGDIVKLQMTNLSTDWETGYLDSWDLTFKVVQER